MNGQDKRARLREHAKREISARDVIMEWLEAPPVADPQEGIEEFNEISADAILDHLHANGFAVVWVGAKLAKKIAGQ